MLLSVRPEKVQLLARGAGRFDGEVAERFFLGSQWLYRVATAVGDVMVLCPNDGRAELAEGARVGIDWPDHCTRLMPTGEQAMADDSGTSVPVAARAAA